MFHTQHALTYYEQYYSCMFKYAQKNKGTAHRITKSAQTLIHFHNEKTTLPHSIPHGNPHGNHCHRLLYMYPFSKMHTNYSRQVLKYTTRAIAVSPFTSLSFPNILQSHKQENAGEEKKKVQMRIKVTPYFTSLRKARSLLHLSP